MCKHSFHSGLRAGTHNREKIWFARWIGEGYSVRQLSEQSGHNQKRLRRIIDYWLSRTPMPDESSLAGVKNMIFDGTFIHRPISVLALMDAKNNTLIDGIYGVSENSTSDLTAFFMPLKERGLNPVSCTTDGNPQAIWVLRRLWPDIIIQRCLVHIQRQGLQWCRTRPKRTDAKHLRGIFRRVMTIYTEAERDRFIVSFNAWEASYGKVIAETPEKGRVFPAIKRARSMLTKALPDMFHYLDDPDIPPTTNGLEGYFSRLKGRYRQHRGLSPEKLYSYFNWYFKLRPR